MTPWQLHPRLEADTHPVTSLELCDVRLMDDARYPWLVLVPRRSEAVDWPDLPRADQHRLADEIDTASRALRRLHAPHKLNVATLGNVVSQMHVHVVARFREDAAWPAPVWGVGRAEPHDRAVLAARISAIGKALAD